MIEKSFSRRQAGRLGLAAAISPMLGHLALAADESGKPAAGKIGDFKISLAQWSLHKRLFADRSKTTAMNLDFP
ncbi:MAG: sugar phosphate isomerase/epimerase, partial [Isosphaeraceae bacterium]